jgi:hypothetical protein
MVICAEHRRVLKETGTIEIVVGEADTPGETGVAVAVGCGAHVAVG